MARADDSGGAPLEPGADQEERAAASVAALERGELPLAAQGRLAEERSDGLWTSDLSVAELAAIEEAGLSPLALVLGSATYHLGSQWGVSFAQQGGFFRTYPCPHGYGGMGGFGSFGGGGGGYGGGGFGGGYGMATHEGARTGYTWEHLVHERGMVAAKDLALERLEAEATALGAHGVAGVRLRFAPFAAGYGSIEVTAIGTALRRSGRAPLQRPFLSHLSGQDLWKLLQGGWVPAGLVMGIGVVEVDPGCEVEYQLRSWANSSVRQLSEGTQAAREIAVASLVAETARVGDGAVGVEVRYQTHEVGESRVIELVVTGTAVRRFSKEPLAIPPLTFLPLVDRAGSDLGARR